MKNVITYCRVSTEEQKKNGFSLANQRDRLSSYIKQMKYQILRHFEEDYSAKSFDRPQWNRLKQFCSKYSKKVDKLIFTKWDRFSRNAKQAYDEIDWFKDREIEIYSVDNPLDLSLPESKITLALYLTLSEIENDRLSIRIKEGLRKSKMEGCWTANAPFGFTNYTTPSKKSTLIPDENAKYVLDAYLLLASQEMSIKAVWRQMRSKGMMISRSQFYELIRNPVYIRKVKVNMSEADRSELIEGLHPPIIPTVLFNRVQEILKSKWVKNNTRKGTMNPLYPLRGFLKCSRCGRSLTASASSGSNPNKKYHYYHCNNGCSERMPLQKAHDLFHEYLERISVDKDQFNNARDEIKKEIQRQEKMLDQESEELNNKIAKLKTVIAGAEDKFFEGVIDPETFKNSKKRYLGRIKSLEEQILRLKNFNPVFEFQSRVEKLKMYIELPKKYSIMTFEEKRKLLKSILSEKVILTP